MFWLKKAKMWNWIEDGNLSPYTNYKTPQLIQPGLMILGCVFTIGLSAASMISKSMLLILRKVEH
jgi:hypothetical protein